MPARRAAAPGALTSAAAFSFVFMICAASCSTCFMSESSGELDDALAPRDRSCAVRRRKDTKLVKYISVNSCEYRETTYSSLRKAKDHPSVLLAMVSAVWRGLSNLRPVSVVMSLTLVNHLIANSVRRRESGRVKSYFTSNREGLLMMASSIRSG